MKSINKIWKRIAVILLFYLINFGLWEVIAPIISGEWASFVVYVILFLIVVVLFCRELREEWNSIRITKLSDKRYYLGLIITLVIELVLTLVMLWIAQNVWVEILPANNENVKNQMASVPVILSVIQGCVFAPVIEEMTFRYGIIEKTKSKHILLITTVISIVLFDCIHIVTIPEFFYYIVPSVILTLFYVKHRNVFASIMLHSLINIVGYLSLLIGVL
ncbi:MAG: CPBP family intramembrane metalloprotease [Lachnospiraceae bacterium]|nr:CPBP family intramembrane metalloprotease [Lachnospiraceae bacterium]